MSLILSSTLVFIGSLLFCLLPRLFNKLKIIKIIFPYITVFAAGFMLSIMLVDFIPEMICNSRNHHDHEDFYFIKMNRFFELLGFIVAGISFILLLGLDSIVLHHNHCENEIKLNHDLHSHNKIGTCNTDSLRYITSSTQAIIFVMAISIHSFFEGLAFEGSSLMFEIGIIFHKILESFALGVTVYSSNFSEFISLLLLTIYSFLTPLGMILGKNFGKTDSTFSVISKGLALGSILFIVCVEMIPPNFHSGSKNNLSKVVTLAAGYLISSIVFISNEHQH
ncbi:Zinc transporter ZIP1 [Dictyocoela muelleri]|nr:Zinc transporter ZIP1 [Dictyocoela muelleri]